MHTKIAQFRLINMKLLNTPEHYPIFVDKDLQADSDEFESTLRICTASQKAAESPKDGDNTRFDLEAEIRAHPKSLFVKCFAIKADEMNDNGDYFAYDQLKEATSTFVGVPVFTNHNNGDAEAARGKVVYSWWDDDRKGIMIIARVDAEAYPQLARGIKEEYIMGTSMGCQVKYSLCSICHNKAETPDQYCEHIRERKTRQITAKKVKCQYHKLGDEEQCPLCGSKKGETKTFDVDQKAFEYNYGIRFIENSFVVNPACRDCGVTEVIDSQAFLSKVADITERLPRLLKAASEKNIMCTDQGCVHLAGQKEIEDLNEALDKITSVSQSMLQQKDQLDLEFLSDLVKVLADLQSVTDELTQQGYGRLQSPGEAPQEAAQGQALTGQPPGAAPTPMNPTPGGGSKIESGQAGSVGTVTGPAASLSRHLRLEKLARDLIRRTRALDLSGVRLAKQKLLDLSLRLDKKNLKVPFRLS